MHDVLVCVFMSVPMCDAYGDVAIEFVVDVGVDIDFVVDFDVGIDVDVPDVDAGTLVRGCC